MSLAVQSAFTAESLFAAPFLWPRCPVPGAAILPGTMLAQGIAFRFAKNDTRLQPGQRNLEKQPLQPATRFFTKYESYPVQSQVYEAEEAMPALNMQFGESIALSASYPQHVATKLSQILLQEQEIRGNEAVANDANFGLVLNGDNAGTGKWSVASTDPWKHFKDANGAITRKFGVMEPGQELRLYLTYEDFYSLINNPQFVAKWGDAAAPTSASAIEEKLRDYLMGGYPPEIRANFRLKVGMDTGFTGNVGQIDEDEDAIFLINSGSVLFRAFPDVGSGGSGLELRSWSKGYTLLDPFVETYNDEATDALVWRAKHAKSLEIYDTTGAVKFKNMS